MSEYPHGPAWLERLPTLAGECIEQWSLVPEEPLDTGHSLVIPAGDAILKLNPPDEESEHEADALERWGGRGAARLLGRDDERRALLVERLRPGRQSGRCPATKARLERRLDYLVERLGLDRERTRGWAIAHALAWNGSKEMIDCARRLAS